MTAARKHTPEPWEAIRNSAYWEFRPASKSDEVVPWTIGDTCSTAPGYPDDGRQEANARRIVDCVNACTGINPEAVPAMLDVLHDWYEPDACGCDTFACRGSCVPARTRDVLNKALNEPKEADE